MPVMDGRALLSAIKTESVQVPLGVVVITAEQNETIHQELTALGAALILRKPFTPESFKTGILSLLR
jgi:CheY-like chemotaxis protein